MSLFPERIVNVNSSEVRLYYASRNKGTIHLVAAKGDLPNLQSIGTMFEKERQMSAVPAVLVRDRVSPGPNNLVLSHCHFFSSVIFPKIRGFPGILNHYTGPKALVMGNFGSTSPRQFQLMDDYQFGCFL